jgi:DNA-binding GntR family transcriptional regulator
VDLIAKAAERTSRPTFETKQEQVAEIIRERIIGGFYQRGQKLKQAELAEDLGVSMTPVREALMILEAEGYVLGLAHRGVIVPTIHFENLREVYELRVLLERRLTSRAVKRMTADDVSQLRSIQAELSTAWHAGNRVAIGTLNYRFHFRFYGFAELPQTLSFDRVLWAKYPFYSEEGLKARMNGVLSEHEAFLSALEAGDQPRAVAAMLAHIKNGWEDNLVRRKVAQEL